MLRDVPVRTVVGLALLLVSGWIASLHGGAPLRPLLFAVLLAAWALGSWATDKYRHKYAQRYDTYLLAQHSKAALIMVVVLALAGWLVGSAALPPAVLWRAFGLFVLADLLVSLPRRREDLAPLPLEVPVAPAPKTGESPPAEFSVDSEGVLAALRDLDPAVADLLRKALPPLRGQNRTIRFLDDVPPGVPLRPPGTVADPPAGDPPAALLVGRTRLNDVRRLDRFLGHCTATVAMGGFLAVRYVPLEALDRELRRRHPGWTHGPAYVAHFVWYRALPKVPWLDRLYFSPAFRWIDRLRYGATRRRDRPLSKAEVWGRLAFYGFQVMAESVGTGETMLLAQRQSPPTRNRRPSYYLIVALEKVGLDGRPMRTHKVRSMYPFSEFLQKRIFEDHGLAATGKFQNDFRLTEYGPTIRRYWLDELPQIYDWLRGDIKLVGMRATSRHYLGLYPRELYDLYVQVKPGLVPPIFGEETQGLEEIARVEMTYLQRYWDQPVRTDIRYLWQTFSDIVFRGVRSK